MSQFIDAVEQRTRDLGADCCGLFDMDTIRQALTETLAAAGPVAEVINGRRYIGFGRLEVSEEVRWLVEMPEVGTKLFTAPPADERDARIAELEAANKQLQQFRVAFNDWIERSEWVQEDKDKLFYGMLGMHRADCMRLVIDELRTQLAAVQAALANKGSLLREPISPTNPLPPGCYCKPGRCAAPVIMGRQMGCRDPAKRDAAIATDPSAKGSEAP